MTISKDKIARVLRLEDVEGFIKAGAPSDEYDSEAESIISAIQAMSKQQITLTNMNAVIALVWQKSFNLSDADIKKRIPAFQNIAKSLLS